jgi:hypothetical protein
VKQALEHSLSVGPSKGQAVVCSAIKLIKTDSVLLAARPLKLNTVILLNTNYISIAHYTQGNSVQYVENLQAIRRLQRGIIHSFIHI